MQAKDVMRATIQDSGMSQRQVSLSMGRSGYFIASCISHGRIPSIELMAEIGDVTGHDVIIRNRYSGNEIVVSPPNEMWE